MTQIDWERVDNDKVDDATLALLLLTLHDNARVWKSFDWETLNRLHEKGFISDPKGKQKSVVLSEEGQRERKLCSRKCSYVQSDAG